MTVEKGLCLCASKIVLEETGTIDAKYIAHEMLEVIRAVDKKSVYLGVCDGEADWTACKTMITQAYPWVHFVHCVTHVKEHKNASQVFSTLACD